MGGGLPHGWSTFAAGEIGVIDRQHNVIETEDELRLWFADCLRLGTDRPVTVCGYCHERTRARTFKTALGWFHDHDCAKTFTDDPRAEAA